MKLVQLTKEYKKQLQDMMEEWTQYNNSHPEANHSPWAVFKNDYHDFDYYLDNLDFKEGDIGHVPTTTLFLYDEDRNIFLGAVNIRLQLNHGLLYDGGHIGDGIRPSERNKGYATIMLKLALLECKKLGLKRVLIVCDKKNIGSKRHIEKCGGVLENEVIEEGSDNVELRYWIELDSYNRLEGKNIKLRKAEPKDLEAIIKNIWSDERVYNTMWFNPTFTLEDGKERLLRTINFQSRMDGYFIALKDTDEAIGLCAIREIDDGIYEECGIGIGYNYQGKGYGKELLALLLDLAFNKYNAREFSYVLMKDNLKSKGLMKYFNFEYVKTTKELRGWDNQEFELEYSKLTRESYYHAIPNILPKRIIVVGCPGSGKSYFTRQLRELTGYPVYYLDCMYWNNNWIGTNKEEFIQAQNKAMSKDTWIIDGNYQGTMEERFKQADLIYFLDLPVEECIKNEISRRGIKREDLPSYLIEEEDSEFIEFIRSYPNTDRKKFLELCEKYPNKEVITFTNWEEKNTYLMKLLKK